MARVAITGATGFIGRCCTKALAADGHAVVAIGRDPERLAAFDREVGRCVADLGTISADHLAEVFSNCETVLHFADDADRRGTGNRQSARLAANVAQACRRAGTGRLVVASSIYARLDEQGQPNAYGAAKRAAEMEAAVEGGPVPLILRLPPVYGPDSKGAVNLLAGWVRRGVPIPFGRASAERDYLAISNLTALVSNLVNMPVPAFAELATRPHEPCDGRPVSTARLVAIIARVLGRKPTLAALPPSLVTALARLANRADQVEAAFAPLRCRSDEALGRLANYRPVADWDVNLAYLRSAR